MIAPTASVVGRGFARVMVCLAMLLGPMVTANSAQASTGAYDYDDTLYLVGARGVGACLRAQIHALGVDRNVSGSSVVALARGDSGFFAPRAVTGAADDFGALCRTNSFVPATLVLMADGTT